MPSLLMRQGETGDSLFIIGEGSVDVTVRDFDDRQRHLATLKPGTFFGEMALLTVRPRFATVVTADDTELFELARADLEGVIA